MNAAAKIRVLVVDDSSIVRKILSKVLEFDPDIEVIGTAPDPFVARDKLVRLRPDVMTLDIEMPRMDGLTFLRRVMEHLPTPTVIVSSLSLKGSDTALEALAAGAVDVVAKPAIDVAHGLESMGADLRQVVKAAARANLTPSTRLPQPAAARPRPSSLSLAKTTHQIIAIGSSTGGTEALKVLMKDFPPDAPGTLIVQHMPPIYTAGFAAMLARHSAMSVREARDGDRVLPGLALLAPGNFHMELVRSGAYYYVRLHQQAPLHGVRPAVDYMMRSVAQFAGANAVGVILTGMGRDGAEGLKAMREAGAHTIAQDKATSVVYGMPKVADEIGAVVDVLPLERIAARIFGVLGSSAA